MMVIRESVRKGLSRWSRKGMPKRTKEMWHINKRSSLEQMQGVIKILHDLKLQEKKWDSIKERLNRELARRKLTASRKMMSLSSLGTLLSLLKYFGFLYLDSDSKVMITEAGFNLLKDPINTFQWQLLKLQFTNPIILNDCQNILIFPIRETLKLLVELDYLTFEEIGYILFMKLKKVSDYDVVRNEIINFRRMNPKQKDKIINKFKKTPEGHVTLAKAPSVAYFRNYLVQAKLCTSIKDKLYLNKDEMDSIFKSLAKFQGEEPFNFGDNLELWIHYYGTAHRLFTPHEVKIKLRNLQYPMLVIISLDGKNVGSDIINSKSETLGLPLFPNELYIITVLDLKSGKEHLKEQFSISTTTREIPFDLKIERKTTVTKRTEQIIKNSIRQMFTKHSGFDSDYENRLNALEKFLGLKFKDNRRKGGRLEYLFYELLSVLKEKGTIDDVVWHGHVGKYGIYEPAPGGKDGKPDIEFTIDDVNFVLELTTIRGVRIQWVGSEAASVPDHFVRCKNRSKRKTVGIFSAPSINVQVKKNLERQSREEGVGMLCIEIEELMKLLNNLDRNKLGEYLTTKAENLLKNV